MKLSSCAWREFTALGPAGRASVVSVRGSPALLRPPSATTKATPISACCASPAASASATRASTSGRASHLLASRSARAVRHQYHEGSLRAGPPRGRFFRLGGPASAERRQRRLTAARNSCRPARQRAPHRPVNVSSPLARSSAQKRPVLAEAYGTIFAEYGTSCLDRTRGTQRKQGRSGEERATGRTRRGERPRVRGLVTASAEVRGESSRTYSRSSKAWRQ